MAAAARRRAQSGLRGGVRITTPRVCKTSPRGRWLLASDDDVTRIWDLSRDHPRDSERPLTGHRGPVASISWSPDEQSLVSAGADGRLLRWPLPDTGEAPSRRNFTLSMVRSGRSPPTGSDCGSSPAARAGRERSSR